MRNLVLIVALVGCNKDENMTRPDLSVPLDLAVPRDQGAGATCDAVKQNCPSGQKCTYVTDPNNMGQLVNACVPVTGTAGFEMPCDRDSAGDPGMDTCAAGFFCSLYGWGGTGANPDRHCNQTCSTTDDCPANHHCFPRSPDNGDCIRDCGALGSTSCGGGLVCSAIFQDVAASNQDPMLFLSCRQAGTGGIADACMEDQDCMTGLTCNGMEGNCSNILCDDSHPCPDNDAGLTCGVFGPSNPIGLCQ